MRRHGAWLLVMILIGLLAAWAFPAAGIAAPKGPTVAPLPRARAGLAPAATATFFIAHPGGAEATAGNPIPVPGGATMTFEVRMRDADSADKAAWQVDLQLDACKFETSPVVMSLVGNLWPAGSVPAFSPNPKVMLSGNVLHIQAGQLLIAATLRTATSGRLATLTVKTKPYATVRRRHPSTAKTITFRPARQLCQHGGWYKINDDFEPRLSGLHADQHADPDQHV